MFYETEKGHGLPHNPFKAIVAPRPIGWISTRGADGTANLAPYSFFNGICDTPPIVMFSSSGRKDTVRNAEATGEFVCNLVGEALFSAMNQTSYAYDAGISEFETAGLAEADCKLVKASRVANAPAALECRVTEISRIAGLDGETNNWMVCGQVVGVHIDDGMLTDGIFDLRKVKPVTRLGYLDYGLHPEIVALARPTHG